MVELRDNPLDTGNITTVENSRDIPFQVQRVYYLYDVPTDSSRGAHAHRELQQLIVAPCGQFELVLDDSQSKRTFTLDHPRKAVHVVPGIWREINCFSIGAVCLVLASHPFDEADYIRQYHTFIEFKRK